MSVCSKRSGIILLDKPQGLSSQSAVSAVKRILGVKTAGHTGTLDPLATGLLPVCFGRATRAAEFITGCDKRYRARLKIGIKTDTGDITGKVTDTSDRIVDGDGLAAASKNFVGRQLQTPPMYSALKVDGRKLYDLARQGVTVEREPREIEIYSLDLLRIAGHNEFELEIFCSKGTYVRTLCEDIAVFLGVCGTMAALRRMSVGRFSVENAKTPEDLKSMAAAGDYSFALDTDTVFNGLDRAVVSEAGGRFIRNGADVPAGEIVVHPGNKDCRVYLDTGEFYAVGRVTDFGLTVTKSFFEV